MNTVKNPASTQHFQATRPLPYILGAVLACFLLSLSIQYGHGYYNPISIRLLLASVVLSILLVPALFYAQSTPTSADFPAHTAILFASSLLIFEVILGAQDVYLHYNQNPLFPTFAKGVNWVIVGLIATYWLEFNRSGQPPAWLIPLAKYRFVLVIGLVVLLRVVTVFVSYKHIIDVGIMMQDSSANLLAGRNPYTSPTANLAGFVYLPAHLLLPLPFYLLMGDTRFGSVFWEGVGIGVIYALARAELRSSPKLVHLAELALLLFVLQPRNLFVIEQSWGEPLMVGLMAVTFYFFFSQPSGPLADILLGILLAIKQYLIFMLFPLFILYERHWKRYALTLFIMGVVFLPFLIWNPAGFYAQTVTHFFRLPIQTDALGLTAYFYEQGILLPRWLGPILATSVALGLGLLLKRFAILGYLHTLILTFLALFLFGQQAFANYYYLISFMQVLALIFFLILTADHRPLTADRANSGGQGAHKPIGPAR